MSDTILKVTLGLIGVALVVGFIYGTTYVAKNMSYSFFYENLVESTVRDMVKPEYLK